MPKFPRKRLMPLRHKSLERAIPRTHIRLSGAAYCNRRTGWVDLEGGRFVNLFNTRGEMFGTKQEKTDLPDLQVIQNEWSRRVGLNHRPADYESAALPLSYAGLRGDEKRNLGRKNSISVMRMLIQHLVKVIPLRERPVNFPKGFSG